MKIKIEIDDSLDEDEITIKCKEFDESIKKIQTAISSATSSNQNFVFYKNETEYYFPLSSILFFESDENKILAHSADDVFTVKYKLYELEEILPRSFMRVSKSTIINTSKIYSISKNISSSSLVKFPNTYKQVYISRYYYKGLKEKLNEKRLSLWKKKEFFGDYL